MKKHFRSILSANFYSLILAVKFAGLVLLGLLFPELPDYFGQFALSIGLTSVFFIFAGMRGRLYVFGGIDSHRDYRFFILAVLTLGIAVFAIMAVMNRANEFLAIILAVGLCKFFEMFLEANTSYIQKTRGRAASFSLLNQHSLIVLFVFFAVLLPFGLAAALTAEACVLAFTLLRQFVLLRGAPEPEDALVRGPKQVLLGGTELTIVATLNSAIVSGFLYWGATAIPREDLFIIAKMLALQAFFARIVTSNNIFFLKEIEGNRQAIAVQLRRFALVGLALAVGAVVLWISGVPDLWIMYGFAAVFTLVNLCNIVMRQQIILSGKIRALLYLHAVELLVVLAFCYLVQPAAIPALFAFGFFRIARVFYLLRLY